MRLRTLKPQGLHFRRQVPLAGYIVDFACHSAKVVIEVDGGQHTRPLDAARDRVRDERLRSHGYRVVRVQNHEVNCDLGAVVDGIVLIALERTPAHPAPQGPPSPQGGGKEPSLGASNLTPSLSGKGYEASEGAAAGKLSRARRP